MPKYQGVKKSQKQFYKTSRIYFSFRPNFVELKIKFSVPTNPVNLTLGFIMKN